MPVISDLIAQIEQEDKVQREEDEKYFAEQEKKYQELEKKIKFFKGENEKHMNNIIKGVENLVDNQHTIEKGLEQTENLPGIPIPQEQHGTMIELFSKIARFMNNVDIINIENASPDEIHQEVVSNADTVANDLKECCGEVAEAQSLFHNIRILDSFIKEDDNINDNIDEVKNLDGSFLENNVKD